jgi:hypothetical protein
LVLQDGTEGATGFTRNRGLLIASIDSATELRVSGSEDLDFDGVGVTVATWKILRGKTLLGTTGNYPDGSYMYGANVVTGVYSDSAAGNQLKAG